MPRWKYAFPQDHHSHPGFKTEWWYVTGNVTSSGGKRFGYQLTFFRQGIQFPGSALQGTSRFLVKDLKFAHFALSDVSGQRFVFTQKTSRGAFGEAGFDKDNVLAWIEDWSIELTAAGGFRLRANHEGNALDFELEPSKPWIIHGKDGVSQKAEGEGFASHYYSGTRMRTAGVLTAAGKREEVTGTSWFDHEWATNQLTPEQAGWNWFALQLEDGSELMLYQMRLKNGESDPASSGTFIAKDGKQQHLTRAMYTLKPVTYWTSKATGGKYPVEWDVEVPSLNLKARVSAAMENQELVIQPISYWEGAVDARGSRDGQPLSGRGYMELTGYAGALVGLSQ